MTAPAAVRKERELLLAVQVKRCSKCKHLAPLSAFRPNKLCWLGLQPICNFCANAYSVAHRAARKAADPSGLRASERDSYVKRRAANIAKAKRWNRDNRARRAELERERRKNPVFALHGAVSASIREYLKTGKGGHKAFDLLGYGREELAAHLERQFTKGMSWENYGKFGWHIDHIVPLASFSFESSDDPDFRRAWALSNLRPLWAKENHAKQARRTHLL